MGGVCRIIQSWPVPVLSGIFSSKRIVRGTEVANSGAFAGTSTTIGGGSGGLGVLGGAVEGR